MGDRVTLQLSFPNRTEAKRAQALASQKLFDEDGLDLRDDAEGWDSDLNWYDCNANFAGERTRRLLAESGVAFKAEWSHGGEFDGGQEYAARQRASDRKCIRAELPCGWDGGLSVPVIFDGPGGSARLAVHLLARFEEVRTLYEALEDGE